MLTVTEKMSTVNNFIARSDAPIQMVSLGRVIN